ncbi:MAG: FG-GAP-like repeat-containing protein [candidate division WOR-3 bacterium]
MTPPFIIFLLFLSPASGSTLESFLARREYQEAVTFYQKQLRRKPNDITILHNLARVYDHWHRFDSSRYWWEKALELNHNDDTAIIGRWLSLYRLAENDSTRLIKTKELILREALPYLAETTCRSLSLAYEGLSLADTALASAVAALLTTRFPDSSRSYELIGAMFYDSLYPVWNNDTAKIPIIHRFLERYPESEWRQTFYMFLLSSCYGLRDTVGIRAAAAEMIQDDTLDPFRYRYAAAVFNRIKLDPMTAERYALAAIRLEPKTQKPRNKPAEQWELEYPPLYGLARLALAEALLAQNRLAEAKDWLLDALRQFRYDPQQEATPGPFHCLLGEVYEQSGETLAARLAFVRSLETGDSRNYWTSRADSGLMRLGFTTAQEQLNLGRTLLGYAGPCFTDVTDSFGLEGRRESRVAWADYNNDGFDDLLLNGCRLYRNDSGRHFTDVTDSVGLAGARGRGGVWADYNNDGWLDLYMSGSDTVDRLWKNHFGRFSDVTDSVGRPSDPYPTEGAAWADFDNDGWIDLYCANYENWEQHTYYPDRLYQNQKGTFKDITRTAGIFPPYGKELAGRGVAWADYDNDGYQDCYVSNYRLCENFLWHNNRNSTFTNLAGQLGVAGDEVNGWFGHTIGSSWADYDNDGDLDLFCANLAHPRYIEFSNRSMLYENLGPKVYPRFRDCRATSGIRYEETHSDPAWADVDNDGDLDLYITSIYEGRRSFLYLNDGRLRRNAPVSFREVTWLSGTRCFNGWGCAFSDFDNDGDLDLVVGSSSGVRLFRNDTENESHWLKVRAIGSRHNAASIGARVIVTQGKRRWLREVEGGKGTTSQNSIIQHFGLGPSALPVTVEVQFGPNSKVIQKGIKPDQLLVITEP